MLRIPERLAARSGPFRIAVKIERRRLSYYQQIEIIIEVEKAFILSANAYETGNRQVVCFLLL